MRMHIKRYHSGTGQHDTSIDSQGSLEEGEVRTPKRPSATASSQSSDVEELQPGNPAKIPRRESSEQEFTAREKSSQPTGIINEETGNQNSLNSMVDFTIEEVDDEEETSMVMESWGRASSSGVDRTNTWKDEDEDIAAIEEQEYMNYREEMEMVRDEDGYEDQEDNRNACYGCGKIFDSELEFERHECSSRPKPNGSARKYLNAGQRVFECPTCGEMFERSDDLMLHCRIHTGVKPFACDDCGQVFIQRTELNAHMQAEHGTSMQEYDCPFCPKSFLVKKSLDSHKRRNHGNIIHFFNCQKCGRQFTAKKFLDDHLRGCRGRK
jgi:predicted RNA-binding Zn-ribbon protein involved in translation (DUF1610 family)